MKIAFNPSTVAALIAPPNNKDITFDLRGHNIFARGVKFLGTDTNTWRDIKINNVSIGSHTLDLRNGSNTTLTNINGVVTINSTWRPVVDNLTSNSTTSSLSANLGRVLAGLINTLGTNISNLYALRDGSNATGRWRGGLACFDVRDTNYTPHDLNMGLELLFVGNNTNNLKDGGEYNGVFSFRQWSYGSDWSGGKAHLLSFTDNENIWHRTSSGDDFWGTWKKLAYSTDIPSSLKNPHALTISLNGTSQGPYDGSAAKNINITPGSIGAATSDHNHDGRYVRYYAVTTLDCNNLAPGLTAAKVSATNAAHTNHSAYLYISDVGTPFQIQIPDSNVPYIYKRYYGSGGWSGWFKLNAGYADSAGSVAWANITGKPSSFTPSAHTHSWTSITDKIVAGNEFNIVNAGFTGDIYFNYVPINDRSSSAYIHNYIFGNGHKGLALVYASGFIKNGSSDSYVLLGGGGHKLESALNVNYANSAGNADTVDGYHASAFVKIKLFRFNQYNQGTWTKILTITINSTADLLPVIAFSWIPSECSRTIWADFSINWRSNSPIFYAIWKGMDSRTLKVVNSSGAIWDVWVSGSKTGWDPFGEIQVTYTHNITSYNGGSLGYSDTDPGGTICITGGQVNYATYAAKLATARTIWGQSFDGTRDVSGFMKNVTGLIHGNSIGDDWSDGNNTHPWYGIDYRHCVDSTEIGKSYTSISSYFGLYFKTGGFRFIFDGGDVGIGTASPIEKLDVHGNIISNNIRIYGNEVTNDSKGLFIQASDKTNRAFLTYNGNTSDGYLNICSTFSHIVLSPYRNVGIGTTTPSYKLHVEGSIYSNGGFHKNGSNDSYVLLGGGGHKAISDFAPSSHSHNYAANENYGGFTKSGRLPISGFYQSVESESGGNAPWSSWMHLINCLHSNTNNNYALLIAASFFDNNTFKIRVTNDNVNNDWRDIIHSGNIGSQTVANAYHLRINSANTWSTWYWSGLSGQPSWLWGSNDGTNMYVWNPNNFNVNTALYLRSLGNLNCQTGRTLNYGDVYTYNTYNSNTGSPTSYTSVIGFGRGIGGTVEIAGGWCNTGLYWRSLRDCCDDWYSWRTVLDSNNYTDFMGNYYWANVKISTSSSTTTSPIVSNLTATNSIRMNNISLEHTDEINNITNGGIHLNYRNSGNVSLCYGGGSVGIGTTTPSYKLDVNGLMRAGGFHHSSVNSDNYMLLAGGGYKSFGGDDSNPIFLGYLNLDHGNDGTVSSSFSCLGYSVPFTYTRGGNYCRIYIPDTTHQVFYIKAAIASVHYSGGGMDTWVGDHRGTGAWWLHCYASGVNEVRVKGFRQANSNNDSWWGGNPLYSGNDGANKITVCIFGYVKFR